VQKIAIGRGKILFERQTSIEVKKKKKAGEM
jgi:hypothetical protein